MIEVTRRRGGLKRREASLASDQFPKCSPQPRTHKDIHRVEQRREGGGGDRGDLVEKKESPKGKRAVKPVISLPSKNGY